MKLFRFSALLALIPIVASGAVSLNQVETFDSPTGWTSGAINPNPPRIFADTGPQGTGDSALVISSSVGNQAGSRLVSFNITDWSGNYSGQGITGLRMDLRNPITGGSDLFVRVAVNGPGGWFATDAQSVNAGLGYASFLFDITPASLTPARDRNSPLGTDPDATLASVAQIRILHNETEGLAIGAVANATLRVDNITAVPEPGITLLAGASLFFCLNRKVRLQIQ